MDGNSLLKKASLYFQSGFYLLAGANHFINPEFYLELIPPYLSFHESINWFSGVLEMALGLGLLLPKTRRWAAYGIIAMLIAFIPSHVYFIQIGSCTEVLCTAPWIGWMRLIIVHPLLILWAYYHRS